MRATCWSRGGDRGPARAGLALALLLAWVTAAGAQEAPLGRWRLTDGGGAWERGWLVVEPTPEGARFDLEAQPLAASRGERPRAQRLVGTAPLQGPYRLERREGSLVGALEGREARPVCDRFELQGDALVWSHDDGPASGQARFERVGPRVTRIVVLHTNDLHGHVLPGPGAPGFAALAARVREERAAAARRGDAVLLLDAGDAWQGTLESQATGGRLVVELMSALGYDAMAVGNHELDGGLARVASLQQAAAFPWLSANLAPSDGGLPFRWLQPAVVLERGGVRVGVVGLTTEHLSELTRPRDLVGVAVQPAQASAAAAVARCRAQGAQVVLLLSHCGRQDAQLADDLPGIAAVVGGHTHHPVSVRSPRTGVVVAQAGCYTQYLGRLTLVVDAGTGATLEVGSELLRVASGAQDPPTQEVVRRFARELAPLDEAVGAYEGSPRSAGVGQWIADLMRERTGAPIALHNLTGVRGSLPRGPVTRRQLFEVSPFGNTVVTLELTGAQLHQLLARAARSFAISGLHPGEPPTLDDGTPVRPDGVYRVATNEFLAAGGDGHAAFRDGRNRVDTDLGVYELTLEAAARSAPAAAGMR